MTSSPEGDGSALARARREAINVVQWLARVAQSYVTSAPLERRPDLIFRVADAAFVTKPFENGVALEMRLPDLHLQFLQNGKPVPHVFDPQERSPAEAEAWILVELLHRGIDREKFSKQLPYTVPGLLTGDAEDYAPQACREGLAELAAWFGKAAAVLAATARASGTEKPAIVCLPQTLDLALASESASEAMALGFSTGNANSPTPHFYAIAGEPGSAEARRTVMSASELLAHGNAAQAAVALMRIAAH
jgi:hypothetical protein